LDAFGGTGSVSYLFKQIGKSVIYNDNLEDEYEQAIAYFALFQACIIKRPYNLFHRKNLYVRMAKVKRSFGNKKTWDSSFEEMFLNLLWIQSLF